MSVKALEVIEPFNLTLVHRVMEFGPYYGDQNITAYLEVANPITVCNGIQEDYSNLIVLAMKHENSSCSLDKQVWILQNAGARAVIIMDNMVRDYYIDPIAANETLASLINITSVLISNEDGVMLLHLNTTLPILVSINANGEYSIIESNGRYLVLSLYISCIIAGAILSCIYYSDWAIVKRMLKKRKLVYKSIPTVTICQSRDPLLDWLNRIAGFTSKDNDLIDIERRVEYQNECPICLSNFAVGDQVKLLPCGHIFHKACLDPWFLDHSSTCPICKRHITKKGMAPLEEDSVNYELAVILRNQLR